MNYGLIDYSSPFSPNNASNERITAGPLDAAFSDKIARLVAHPKLAPRLIAAEAAAARIWLLQLDRLLAEDFAGRDQFWAELLDALVMNKTYTSDSTASSRQQVATARRIVIKVGTNVVMRDDGRLALSQLYGIAESVARLRQQGRDVLMVSSGAVGLGMERIGLARRPTELSQIQACAAIGQSRLMAIYDDAFDKLGCRAAQVLLTEDDFRDPERYSNLRSTLASLLKMGVIPIINENDTVSTVELDHPADQPGRERVFGDNDKLSALVMTHVEADVLLLLSDVDGLYDGDPAAENSKLIAEVPEIDDETRNFAQGKNGRGRGGMASKLEAARIVTEAGGLAVIANGRMPTVIERVCAGEEVGTLFLPRSGA